MGIFVELTAATLGTLGFSLLYNIRGKKLIAATIGGLLAWAVYLVLQDILPSATMRYLVASATMTVYAETMARLMRTPTTTFLAAGIIPLVPGSGLYRSMNYLLNNWWDLFLKEAARTLELALCIAVGIIAVTTLTRIVMTVLKKQVRVH